jgi:WD40 repeat protein
MSSPIVAAQETSKITPRQKFEGHTKWIKDVIHLPGGERILTGSWDGSLRVWDMKNGKQIGDKWRDRESLVAHDGVVSGREEGG